MMRRILLMGALLGLLSACVHVPRISDYVRDGKLLEGAERSSVIQLLRDQSTAISSLKLLSRCTLIYDDQRIGLRYAFVASANGELRVEQFPTTGFYALTTLVSSEDGTTVVFQNEQKAVLTSPGASALSALFGFELPLDTRSAAGLLEGTLSSPQIDAIHEIRKEGEKGSLVAYAPHFIASYGAHNSLEQFHLFDADSGKELLSVSYVRDGEIIPTRFTLSFPREQASLECTAQKRVINDPLQPTIFHLDIPPGFSIDDRR